MKTDRDDAMYHAGEKVTFQILLRDGAEGEKLECAVMRDGRPDSSSDLINHREPIRITRTWKGPAFFKCEVTYRPPATKPVIAMAGAAVDPEQIKPSMPAPDDFDAFWSAQTKLLADDPARPVLTAVNSKDESVETFDVQINCPGGAPMSGYFARPKNAKDKSLPAILYPHSAGVRNSDLPHAIKGAKLGCIALDFNAHGIPNGKPDKFYADLASGELKGYPARGASDRETIYFRGMYLRLLRALDFLTQRPEWDGKVLIVEGSSQGGGQALVAAGLDPRVTLCIASVPALCDHTGFKANRIAGWPRIVPRDANGNFDEKIAEASRYIDAVNFAARIKCPTYVTVGFIDNVCAPSSVYAAYNNIPAGVEKHIINRPAMGHAFPPDLIAHFDDVIRRTISP